VRTAAEKGGLVKAVSGVRVEGDGGWRVVVEGRGWRVAADEGRSEHTAEHRGGQRP